MRSTVVVYQRWTGGTYVADAAGRFGGGYSGARAGTLPHEAAAFAGRAMLRYAATNPEGGDLMAPPEVAILVPAHLHHFAGRS